MKHCLNLKEIGSNLNRTTRSFTRRMRMKWFFTGDPRLSLNLRECVYALDVWGDYEISSPKRIEIGETVE
jgi:hypothetical protein